MNSGTGRIIRAISGFFDVDEGTGKVYRCKARGIFRAEGLRPVVGDYVSFDVTHEGDLEGNISHVLERRNTLIRPVVSNVDQALIIFAMTHPDPNFLLLDKFLIMMKQQDVPVIICFNKTDLTADNEKAEASLRATYAGSGSEVIFISVKEGEGIDRLASLLKDRTTVLAGPSGVGKSSLINLLYPEAAMETGELSRKIARGKNTTRHSELFHATGGVFEGTKETYLLDTPGFTSLDIRNVIPRDLHLFYEDFTPYRDNCAFADCAHLNEPDCAVKDALDEGAISRVRYDTYRLLHEELSGRREVYVKK